MSKKEQVQQAQQVQTVAVAAQAIRAAATFASKDKTRLIITALEVKADAEGFWRITATDSYKLLTLNHKEPGDDARALFIDAAHAAKALKTSDQFVFFMEKDNAGKLVKVSITSKGSSRLEYWPLVEGKFPEWRSLLPASLDPSSSSHAFALNPAQMATAANITDKFMDKNTPVTVWTLGYNKPVFFKSSCKAFDAFGLVMPVKAPEIDKLSKKAANDAQGTARKSDEARAEELERKELEAFDRGYNEAEKALKARFEAEKAEAVEKALEAYKAQQQAQQEPAPVELPPVPPVKAVDVIAEKPTKQQPEAVEHDAQELEQQEEPDSIARKLEALEKQFPGLIFTQKHSGACVWCSGDTKPQKDALKAEGFKWSNKRKAWYRAA